MWGVGSIGINIIFLKKPQKGKLWSLLVIDQRIVKVQRVAKE